MFCSSQRLLRPCCAGLPAVMLAAAPALLSPQDSRSTASKQHFEGLCPFLSGNSKAVMPSDSAHAAHTFPVLQHRVQLSCSGAEGCSPMSVTSIGGAWFLGTVCCIFIFLWDICISMRQNSHFVLHMEWAGAFPSVLHPAFHVFSSPFCTPDQKGVLCGMTFVILSIMLLTSMFCDK